MGIRRRPARHQGARRGWWLQAAAATVVVGLAAAGLALPRGSGRPAEAAVPALTIGAAHGASYVPALSGKRPLFILVLGSDERKGLEGRRNDSIHIIGVNLKQRRASILGIPRDLFVPIPGHGTQKITTALDYGGPSLAVEAVEGVSGIRMDFWAITTFKGFKQMVDRVGGLKVEVPYPMHDRFSGSDFKPGRRKMNGKQALAFARDRHSPPGGDFGRTVNQGRLLLSALRKLQDDFGKDPSSLFDWIAAAWRGIDTDLSVPTLLDLALTATKVKPAHVNNLALPGSSGFAGAQSVVFPSSAAHAMFADLRRDGVIGSTGR